MKVIATIRSYRPIVIWAAILAALYFLVIGLSQSFQQCVQQESVNRNHNTLNEIISVFFGCNVTIISNHSPFIEAISAFALVIVTIFLVWSGLAQVSTTKKQLRAYISVDEMVRPQYRHVEIGPSGKLRTLASMKNLGDTPAVRLQFAFGLQVWPKDLPIEIFKTAKWSEKQIIHPKQEVVATINDSETMGSTTWNSILDGTIKTNIYAFGIVRYEDIFGAPHFTQFCFRIDYRNGPKNPPGWDWYKDYNKTDDQKEYISDYIELFLRHPFRWGIMVGAILNPPD